MSQVVYVWRSRRQTDSAMQRARPTAITVGSLPTGVLGSPCSLQMDCTYAVNNSFCNATTSGCQCEYNYTAVPDLTSCVPRRVGDSCAASDQCQFGVADSTCYNHACHCQSGYANVDPSTNATCLRRRINDTCDVPTDCSDAVQNSTCDANGKCSCVSGFYSNVDGTQCIERKIGDQCTTSTDCTSILANSLCSAGSSVCQCVSGFMAALNDTTCILRTIDDPCSVDVDCVDAVNHSLCLNGSCQCVIGYQPIDGNQCILRKYKHYTFTDWRCCSESIGIAHCFVFRGNGCCDI